MLASRSLLAVAALAVLTNAQGPAEADALAHRVRPLLSDRCFTCHGFDAKARKGNLRLDTREGQLAAIEDRVPVVPGDPSRSELIRRIESDDPKLMMPPPDSGRHLDAAEKALLRRWVEAGAPFAGHWAFEAPREPRIPEVEDQAWPRNPIDRFVLARLQADGITPNGAADRATLIRRVTLDLTGLPPTPERIDAFVNDTRPDAYERLVDELFASPHYGERMAQMWLDVARYADTNGFHHDNVRTAWPYRDWVIDAFQHDLPYDRFLEDQLAGDLVKDPTEAQRIATGFCRMHNINDEGGAIDAEYRVEAVADRIETIATATMGLTFTCARCHDHKYDPFTQDDYYSLCAIFGSVDERGVYPAEFEQARAYPARLQYAAPDLRDRIAKNEQRLADVRARLVQVEPEVAQELRAWEESLRGRHGIEWMACALRTATTAGGTPVTNDDDGAVHLSGRPAQETLRLALHTEATGLRMLRLDLLAGPDGRVGLAQNGNAVVSAIRVRASSSADPKRGEEIPLDWAWADFEQPNGDFDVLNAIRGDGDGWALGGHLREGGRTALLFCRDAFGFEGGTEVTVEITCASRYQDHVIAGARVQFARADAATLQEIPLVTSDWWRAGPFPAADFATAWTAETGPERATSLDRGARFGKVSWQHRPDDDAKVVSLSGERSSFDYARELRTPRAMRVPIALGSDDAIRVFLDGKELLADEVMRPAAPDQEKLVLDVPPGEHLLVVKVVNGGGPGGFYGRFDRDVDAPEPLRPWALVPPGLRDASIGAAMLRGFGMRSPTYAALEGERKAIETERAALEGERVPTLVMSELPEPKPYFVLQRGRYDMVDTARPVGRRPPLALGGAFPAGEPQDRLGFAHWLTRRDHPLTARVAVNRLWQMVFGIGLVATTENFGQQADPPSHPELLDWLAVHFVEGGWSQRELLRLIVTSATYRQSARVQPAVRAIDPDDRLLSSFPRRRLPGEFVRDLALAASGLMVEKVGGPSVKPYEPEGLWTEVSIGASSNTQVFQRDSGDALWRRSLYTFWKRTSPNPQMATFDAPTREFCVVRRAATNTPLQALVLWNDEQFVEAARNLAQRVMREAGDDTARLDRMFRLCTGRHPSARESSILRSTLLDFRNRYRGAATDAEALLGRGESRPDPALDPIESAALTMVASTVLSLDDTIVRD
ncbi:MAG: PSD1 and planctomycete cytochrome C domain-containing protein [Planctomycetota bacterium]